MLPAKRPKAPKGFNLAARDARSTIRSIVIKGGRPESDDFVDTWSAFKQVLAEAQKGRCGYCDRHVLGGDDGTVDHYRPKTEINALYDDPTTWGTQTAHSASIEGRRQQPVSDRGYHWLAYAWSNYVFACDCCNVKWKRAFFPVGTHPRCCPPRPRGLETPLLLNCYLSLRPSSHLQFNADGTVEPVGGSPYGYETIRTVGLHRDPLRIERSPVAADVHEAVREYADGDDAEQERAKRDLCRLGDGNRAFAGVARAIVEQLFGMSWQEFLTL